MCDNSKDSYSYNCKLTSYPTGQHVAFYANTISVNTDKPINENFCKTHQNKEREKEKEMHCKQVSLSRTKNKIYHIARSSTWEWFITLTFDRNITDSSSYDIVIKKLTQYLNDIEKRKCPDIKYLVVPELHADGAHYHFHGLLSNVDGMRFRYSGHDDKKGNPIYNILDWKAGFTTATRVTDTDRVSSYITKYITKGSEQYLKNKKRYYASRNITLAETERLIMDRDDFEALYSDRITYCKTINVPAAHQQITYYELKY